MKIAFLCAVSLLQAAPVLGIREVIGTIAGESADSQVEDPICEAFMYFTNDAHKRGRQWEFLNNVSGTGIEGALDAARKMGLSDDGVNILGLSINLRQYVKSCTKHHQSARSASPDLESPPRVFAVVHNGCADEGGVTTNTFVDLGDLKSALATANLGTCDPKIDCYMNKCGILISSKEATLPANIYGSYSSAVVALYGEVGSAEFGEWFTMMQEFVGTNVKLVVRHMEPSEGTQECSADDSESCVNSAYRGYGVSLEVLDEESDDIELNDETNLDEEAVAGETAMSSLSLQHSTDMGVLVNDFLEGVQLKPLAQRLGLVKEGEFTTDLNVLMHYKLMDDIDDEIVSERDHPNLPAQAAAVVLSADDPLWKMQDISHNLPSRVPLLKLHEQLGKSFTEEIQDTHISLAMLTEGARDPLCYLYINGRAMNVTNPNFTMFNLLKQLRDEEVRLDILNEKLDDLPVSIKQQVIDEFEGEEDFLIGNGMNWSDDITPRHVDEDDLPVRFDVARGGKKALITCNDIEKDDMYSDWPTSTSDLLNEIMANDPGITDARREGPPDRGPTTIRRNALNYLLVVDPLSTDPLLFNSASFGFVRNLMENEYPVRLQILFATEGDLDDYALDGDNWQGQPQDTFCTGADVMALFMEVLKTYDHFKAIDFLGIWSSNLENFKKQYPGLPVPEKGILLQVFAAVMSQTDGATMAQEEASELGLQALASVLVGNSTMYGEAIEFAHNKGLRPGMTFLNGCPFEEGNKKLSRSERYKKAELQLREEQELMLINIAGGEITDELPKSIYAHYLSGRKVVPKYYPGIVGSTKMEIKEEKRFISSLPETNVTASVSVNTEADIVFRIDAFLDLMSKSGLEAMQVLTSLASVPRIQISGEKLGFNVFFHGKGSDHEINHHAENFITINGRILDVPQEGLTALDIEKLMMLELPRTRGLNKYLAQHTMSLPKHAFHNLVAEIGAILGSRHYSPKSRKDYLNGYQRINVQKKLASIDLENNDFHFSWNKKAHDVGGVVSTIFLVLMRLYIAVPI